MDILCTRCGEPWEVCSLVDDMTPQEASKLKRGDGCPCCEGKEPCLLKVSCDDCEYYSGRWCQRKMFKPINQEGREAMSVLAGVLGDDVDGMAAMLDDFGLT